MKVSVAWIAVGIILGIILYFTVKGFSIYEQFVSKEGFQVPDLDIHITTCPAETISYVDAGGRSVCCDGEVVNGKCSGPNVCSLSEAIAGLPTCSAWLDAYLDNNSNRCPASMPRYYENKTTKEAGCTAGDRNRSGTGPASTASKFCTLYNSQEDALLKRDSCENQKILEDAKCLSVKTTKSFMDWGEIPPPIHCTGINTSSLTPLSCIDDSSFERSIDYWANKNAPHLKNWREQSTSWGAIWKMNFCSSVQKVTVDKSMSLSSLESHKVF